ncbi:haloacid dehalogenase-like hydrolase [Rhizoctonia solani 123E]|uniref:Haloacid dehalogenase-like hydrolase n=1 Tax=Rhizoctonia solani 123E TaxID=1423351 RepID=A0A074T0N2_9AGAM|nr:haloacid dehalogenase-like hydrolase [Rhizoctonia solani 123E]
MSPSTQSFIVDAALFDMDGTLVDSIAAVEKAWGNVAEEIGQDPEYVIAATHGKRAIDNLRQFKPHLKPEEIEAAVSQFEQTILDFADEYGKKTSSYQSSIISSPATLTPSSSAPSSAPSSRRSSRTNSLFEQDAYDIKFRNQLAGFVIPESAIEEEAAVDGITEDIRAAWNAEHELVDRSVRILPGVRDMIDSIPKGRYAVATSGARTYAYGAMSRVGIIPPEVTITACDKRLKAGKPAPDPFILAADCLGFDPKRCVVWEDSPSGIRAGVASGAIVIAVCTSHIRDKIAHCGAHYIVENMESVQCDVQPDGRLKFTITSDA